MAISIGIFDIIELTKDIHIRHRQYKDPIIYWSHDALDRWYVIAYILKIKYVRGGSFWLLLWTPKIGQNNFFMNLSVLKLA